MSAVAFRSTGLPWPSAALVVLLGAAPLVVGLAAVRGRRRTWAGVAVAAGALLVAAGVLVSVSSDALHLLRMDFPLTQVLTDAATVLAPLGLVLVGLVLALAGAAGWIGDRLLAGLAATIGVVTGVVVAVALLASALQPLSYRGGSVRGAPVVAAAVTGLAALLLVVVVTRWWVVGRVRAERDVTRAGTGVPRASRRRAVRWGALAVLVVLVAGAAVWSRDRLSSRLYLAELFPDPALVGCVASALGSAPTDPVSERELSGVLSLDCSPSLSATGPVQGLAGIGNLPGLVELGLASSAVHDLRPLVDVPQLGTLTLTNNAVSDLGPLARLSRLSDVGLSGNYITDLGPLAGLTSLRHLGLSDNRITDLTPLAGLTGLSDLEARGNQVVDVSPLASLGQLDRLTLADNLVTDPSPLRALPALSMLDVSGNLIADARTVASCTSVDELWIGGNPLTDLTPLLTMRALTGVDLSETDSTGMVGIEELRARGVHVGGLA